MTALATPFAASGAVDSSAWRRLLEQQLEGGTQALVVAGSTGEAAALDDEEYVALVRSAAQQAAGRAPVIAAGITGLLAIAALVVAFLVITSDNAPLPTTAAPAPAPAATAPAAPAASVPAETTTVATVPTTPGTTPTVPAIPPDGGTPAP